MVAETNREMGGDLEGWQMQRGQGGTRTQMSETWP